MSLGDLEKDLDAVETMLADDEESVGRLNRLERIAAVGSGMGTSAGYMEIESPTPSPRRRQRAPEEAPDLGEDERRLTTSQRRSIVERLLRERALERGEGDVEMAIRELRGAEEEAMEGVGGGGGSEDDGYGYGEDGNDGEDGSGNRWDNEPTLYFASALVGDDGGRVENEDDEAELNMLRALAKDADSRESGRGGGGDGRGRPGADRSTSGRGARTRGHGVGFGGTVPRHASGEVRQRKAAPPPREVKPFRLSYANAKAARQREQEAVKAELEAKQMAECTFRPQLTKRGKRGGTTDGEAATKEERFAMLANPRKDKYEQRLRQLEERANREMKECTFRPFLLTSDYFAGTEGGADAKAHAVASGDAGERLYKDAEARRAKLAQAREARQRAELAMVAEGQANVARGSNSAAHLDLATYRPIHERAQEVLHKRNAQLAEAKAQADEQAMNKVKAFEMSEMSRLLTADRPPNAYAEDSLDGGARRRAERNDKVRATLEAGFTFQPEVTEKSRQLAVNSAYFGGDNADFLTRQQRFLERKHRKIAEAELAARNNPEHTFHPNVAPSAPSGGGAASGQGFTEEEIEERVERLAHLDRDRKAQAIEKAKLDYYAQYTFHPVLSKRSKEMGKGTGLEELYKNERYKAEKARRQAEADRAFQESFKFKPSGAEKRGHQGSFGEGNYSKSVLDLQDPNHLTERIRQLQEEKDAAREQKRRELEKLEMNECTFKPKVKPSAPREASGPIVVRGLGRHLEMQEKAKLLKAEQAVRLERAFSAKVDPLTAPNGQRTYTIPKPFSFQPSSEERNPVAATRLVHRPRSAAPVAGGRGTASTGARPAKLAWHPGGVNADTLRTPRKSGGGGGGAHPVRHSVRENSLNAEGNEHTFKPATTGLKKREVIRRILEDADV